MRKVLMALLMIASSPALAETSFTVYGFARNTTASGAGDVNDRGLGYAMQYIDRSGIVFQADTSIGYRDIAGRTDESLRSQIGLGYALERSLNENAGTGQEVILGFRIGAERDTRGGTTHVTTTRALFGSYEIALAPGKIVKANGEVQRNSRNDDTSFALAAAYEYPIGERFSLQPTISTASNGDSTAFGFAMQAGYDLGRGMELQAAFLRGRTVNDDVSDVITNQLSLGLELNF